MRLLSPLVLAAGLLTLAATMPANAQSAATYRIVADTVTSGNNPGVQGVACVNETVFFPSDVVVFRAVVADGASGTPLTQADLASRGITLVVTTSEGRSIPMRFGMHPPPNVQAPKRAPYWSGTMPIGQDAGVSVLTIAEKK